MLSAMRVPLVLAVLTAVVSPVLSFACGRTDDVPCLEIPNCAKGHAIATDFKVTNTNQTVPARQSTEFRLCHSAEGLHFRSNATDNHIFTPYTECNDEVFSHSDVLEVFAGPVHSPTDNPIWYHECDVAPSGATWLGLINNPRGNVSSCDECHDGDNGPLPCKGLNTFTGVDVKVTVHNDTSGNSWGHELFLPWNLFPAEFAPKTNPTSPMPCTHDLTAECIYPKSTSPTPWPLWRLNMYRYDYPDGPDMPYELSGWSSTHDPSFHVPARFGVAVLV